MVEESVIFMREHEPPEGYTLADSYGKDSTVLLELVRMAGVKYQHIHHYTGIDPPELIRFGKMYHPGAKIIRPQMTLWEGIHKKFPPTIQRRWCCDVLKHGNGKANNLPQMTLVGVRAEESAKRRGRPRIHKANGICMVKPIFHWSTWHIWEFIEGMGLPYCELYDQGFDRIGCCVCPMITSKNMGKVNQHRKRWPGYYKVFEHAVTHWFYNHAWWYRHKWKTAGRYIQAWYRAFQ